MNASRSGVKGRVARGGRGGWWFGLGVLSLGLVGVWVGGCQQSGSTASTPAAQAATPAASAAAEATPATAPEKAQTAKPRPRPTGRQPQITIEKDVCDLGEIGTETKATGKFEFINTGTAPLKITHVVSCCGSTVKGVEAGQEYAPGATGTLEFELKAPSIPVPALKRILYLQSNDPECSIASLTVKASVVRRVDFKPERLSLVLRGANGGCPDITLTSLDHKPFSITSFETTADTITAPFDSSVKATEFVLKPKVDMAKLGRNLSGRISIGLTHPECQNVEIWYDVLPEFTLNPPNVMMFGLKAGQSVQRDIWILNNYQEDFEIESASAQKGIVRVLETTKVGPSRYQLRVEMVAPARKQDEVLTTDTLQIKIKGGRTLSIPFRGFYQ